MTTCGSETLSALFRVAQKRHPAHLSRFVLRRDKSVVVVCQDETKNAYAKVCAVYGLLARLHPVRLIYCVYPNLQVMRSIEIEKSHTLRVNARMHDEDGCFFNRDTKLTVPGHLHVTDLWKKLKQETPHLAKLHLVSLVTRRTQDHIPMRFGLADKVSDIVVSGGRRFIFVLAASQGESSSHRLSSQTVDKRRPVSNKLKRGIRCGCLYLFWNRQPRTKRRDRSRAW